MIGGLRIGIARDSFIGTAEDRKENSEGESAGHAINLALTSAVFKRCALAYKTQERPGLETVNQPSKTPCDHLRLDFRSTFKDVQDPRITQDPRDAVFQRKPVTPMNLQGIIRRRPGHAGAQQAWPFPASRSHRRSSSFSRAEK